MSGVHFDNNSAGTVQHGVVDAFAADLESGSAAESPGSPSSALGGTMQSVANTEDNERSRLLLENTRLNQVISSKKDDDDLKNSHSPRGSIHRNLSSLGSLKNKLGDIFKNKIHPQLSGSDFQGSEKLAVLGNDEDFVMHRQRLVREWKA